MAMLAGGAVGLFLAPVVTPALGRMMRPAAKAAIKTGMALYRRGLETAGELRETFEDVSAEIAAEATPPSASAAAPSPEEAAAPAAETPASAPRARRERAAVH